MSRPAALGPHCAPVPSASLALFCALVLLGALAPAGPAGAGRSPSRTAVQTAQNASGAGNRPVLRMVYAEGFAPFSWTSDGKVVGILPDIMDEAGRRMGVRVTHQAVPGSEVLFKVRAMAVDGFLSAPAPDYAAIAKASEKPVLVTTVALFVSGTADPLVQSLRLLKDPDELKDLKLGASQYDIWSRRHFEKFDLKIYPSLSEAVAGLAAGEVQAMAQMPEVVEFHARSQGLTARVLRVPGVFLDEVPFHLFVNKYGGALKLLPSFDRALESMRADGMLLAILTRPR